MAIETDTSLVLCLSNKLFDGSRKVCGLYKIANFTILEIILNMVSNFIKEENIYVFCKNETVEYQKIIKNDKIKKISTEQQMLKCLQGKNTIIINDNFVSADEQCLKNLFYNTFIGQGLDAVVVNNDEEDKSLLNINNIPQQKILMIKTDILKELYQHQTDIEVLRQYVDEIIDIRNLFDLQYADEEIQRQLSLKQTLNGALLYNPTSIYLSYDTEIGTDTVVEPNVFFGRGVKIGNECVIKSGCYLEDFQMMNNSNIGPYSRTRGGVVVKENVHIGNFAELKQSTIGKDTKIGHFGYIGNVEIGEKVNIGAGTVFCNYDGVRKYFSSIGGHSFIGANSTIVSPCSIAEESFVAGGSVITKTVNKHDLAIGRERQTNIKNWVVKKGLNKK